MAWQNPKTNWQAADVVSKDDFNRIEGNVQELQNTKETPAGAQAKVDAHASQTSAHSATSEATANRIVLRDAYGRAKVAAPSADTDIANKQFVVEQILYSKEPLDFQEFKVSGTWHKPSGAKKILVQCVGGGGGGAGEDDLKTYGGGGGGNLVTFLYASGLADTCSVVVGAGGSIDGGNGGNSSFETFTAYGGEGGGTYPGAGGGAGLDVTYHVAVGAAGAVHEKRSSPSDGVDSEWGGASGGGYMYAAAHVGGTSLYGGSGGGAGGNESVGASGGGAYGGSGGGGKADGVNGKSYEYPEHWRGGDGGGGGAAEQSPPGKGGDGGFPGGGGGGGGRWPVSPDISAAGGKGGDGVVRVWAW